MAATNRANARQAASAPAAATAPKPRAESTTETPAAEAAPAPKPEVALIVVAPNPKRAGSKAFGFYEKYGKPGVLTTHRAILEAGVRGKDVSWDSDSTRRHILLGDEATEFSKITDRNEQAAYLKGKGVQDRELIKWGYMDKPVEQPAQSTAAEGEKQTETA